MIPANVIRFLSMHPSIPKPERADRSARGTLPTRAFRYCDVVTAAAGWGWHVFPPVDFTLGFDGSRVFYGLPDSGEDMTELCEIPLPGFAEAMAEHAPERLRGATPMFLTALREPGVVQVWTGLVVATAPGWSSLIRRPSNLPVSAGYDQYEGVIGTDRWRGSLFTNIRLRRCGRPVIFRQTAPLLQIAPVPEYVFGEGVRDASADEVTRLRDWTAEDWATWETTMVTPALDPARRIGRHAIGERKRRAAGCPMHAAA